ncbi:MAG: gamma-glutamyltransferase, partial [Rhodospirillales bacterium]|nr:gamma-glutamyltransferase [Rhodospirillales bacterium]
MPPSSWRDCTASHFICEKQPARASRGMVVTNHPLASAAGARILADGGNAIDAAMAGLFALTVVEPMMIGLVGGGLSHIRTADGAHVVIDAMSAAPAAATPTMYRPVPGAAADVFDTIGNENLVGPNAVATPGSLRGWCAALTRYGTMTLADVMAPAIELAAGGFRVTPYLSDCIASAAPDLLADPAARATFLPDGDPLAPGRKLVRGDYADTLRHIAQAGEGALHGGPLGALVAECIERRGGSLSREDLATYQPVMRAPVRASYRGWEIVGPPPPSAAGVHIAQMLGILEGYDIASLGFATPDTLHLLAEVLKIAFADRAAATADPAFVAVPVERLISKEYAAERRAAVEMERTQAWGPGVSPAASPHTTHLTVADAQGNIVASTHTINSLFGARFIVPGTGLIPNNYMVLFDPRPGHALSVAPGKRVTTSMAPMMALRDGKPVFALGLPG